MINLSLARVMKQWILILLFLYLIAPTSTAILTRVIGLAFIFMIFSPLFLIRNNKSKYIKYSPEFNGLDKYKSISILLLQFLFANYAISYYTGNNIVGVIADSLAGANTYRQYQEYFKENELANFTLAKMPAIFSLAAVKFIFIYFVTAFIYKKSSVFEKIIFLTAVVPVILVGAARGTFFEIFEIFIISFYGIALVTKKFKPVTIAKFFLGAVFLIFAFMINTMRRYENSNSYFEGVCATTMYCYDSIGINFYIEYVFYLLSSYFSMGMFFLSKYLELIFEGAYMGSLLPLYSTSFLGIYQGGLEATLCAYEFDCRAVWMAELISWISVFGLILSFVAIAALMLLLTKIEYYLFKKNNIYAFPCAALLLIYLISLPVGKFWTVSSQNILCTFAFGALFLISNYKRRINK